MKQHWLTWCSHIRHPPSPSRWHVARLLPVRLLPAPIAQPRRHRGCVQIAVRLGAGLAGLDAHADRHAPSGLQGSGALRLAGVRPLTRLQLGGGGWRAVPARVGAHFHPLQLARAAWALNLKVAEA